MAGSLADAAAFSFFPSKNLGGFGDGGALTTSDAGVAGSARLLRTRGSKDKRTFTEVGYNSRLDELQAAGLRVLLPHLPDWIDARRRAAGAYLEAGLADLVPVQSETPDGRSAWHILATASSERDRIAAALSGAEIEARPYYETPLYRQPALERWAPPAPLAETERICSQILALPMGSALPDCAPGEVVAAIRSA
jgi:dTDP-3-amino-3,4,6-trideoxy-alpha-D-glucose transaminase